MATVRYTTINGRIVAEDRDGTRRYYASDALGSTVALSDESATKTDSFKYWPYGETRTSTGSSPTKYKFVGTLGCREQADGGIYMRARIEQPKDGRWMTVDPLRATHQTYSYAGANPMSLRDPLGLQQILPPPPPGWWLGFIDPIDPPACKYGCKPVWVTCYEDGDGVGKSTAVYCLPDDTCIDANKKACPCGEMCERYGGRLGVPAFGQGTTICLGGATRKVNDCGCGPKRGHKPQPDDWVDVWRRSCDGFVNHWECACPGPCPGSIEWIIRYGFG